MVAVMRIRVLLMVTVPSAAAVGLVFYFIAVYDGRGRSERIVDCVHKAGLSADVFHDDGRDPATGDPDALMLWGDDEGPQVRQPAETVTVNGCVARLQGYNAKAAVIRVPDNGSTITYDKRSGAPLGVLTTVDYCIAAA